MESRIAQMPPDQQAAAKAELDRQQALWQEIRELPEEQRREKMRELMADPANQERMENRAASRDSRRTPQQRLERYRRYATRKHATKIQ